MYTAADLDLDPFATAGPPVDTPEEMRRPVLAKDKVRFIGEPVAVVVAETREQAVDAASLVDVDYDPLDVVVDMTKALDDDAPKLFEMGNLAAAGPEGEDALADAEVRAGARFINQRVAAVPMEPSAALAKPDPETGGFILYTPSQGPHAYKGAICASTGIEKDKLRVVSTATGGGFGARIACYPEQIVVVALARKLGKAVRYIETRSETMIEMQHGRAQVQDVEIGGTRDGKVTGLKVRVIADCGAYPADAALMPMLTGLMSCGVYKIPKVDFHFDAVVTNTTPIGAYRGAGRPEATALVERAIDMFAVEIGMDPAEVRRKNFIADFPHQTVTGANYDSGEYHAALEKCLSNAGYEQLRADQAERRERGDVVQLGLGLCSYVEWTGFGSELGTCEVHEDGTVVVTAGTSSHGQGHETAYAQLVAGTLGIPLTDIKVIQSDTKLVKRGMGTMGSRSLQVGGTAVQHATDEVLEKAKPARRAPARGRRGRHRGRARPGPRRHRLARLVDPVGAARAAAAADPVPHARGLRGRPRGRERLRDAGRDVPVRHASRRRRGGHRDRPGAPRPSHHGRRLRPDPQPEARSRVRSTAASPRASRRRCSRRSPSTRTATTSPARSRPTRSRAPATCRTSRPSARRRRRRATRWGRRASASRARSARRRPCGTRSSTRSSHLGVRNIDMPATPQRVWQGDQRRELISSRARDQRVDVLERRAEPDARPDRSGQLGLAPGAQLVVQAAGLGLGDARAAA